MFTKPFTSVIFILYIILALNINVTAQSLRNFHSEFSTFENDFNQFVNNLNLPLDELPKFIIDPSKIITRDRQIRYIENFILRVDAFDIYIDRIQEEDNAIKDYLYSHFLPIKEKVYILYLKIREPLWQQISIDERLKINNTKFDVLINTVINKQRNIFNKYLTKEDFVRNLNQTPRNRRNLINLLDEENINKAFEKIEDLEEYTNLFNAFIYKVLTPDFTPKQLEIYLKNAPQNLSDTFYIKAFKNLFVKYTETGEPVTIDEFLQIVNEYDLNLLYNENSFRRFKQIQEDIANYKSDRLNTVDLLDIDEYESVLEKSNNDLNIIAIQKIIKLAQKNQNDFKKSDVLDILAKYKPHFKNNLQYKRFIRQLEKEVPYTYSLAPIELCKKELEFKEYFIDNHSFVSSKSGEKLNQPSLSIYKLEDWSENGVVKVGNTNDFQYFFFNEGRFINHDLESDVQEGGTIKDIFIHKNGKIMLFVSTNNNSRHKDSNNDNPDYYINSFRTNSNSILRSSHSGKGAFRGRENGYENTEIYYSFKEGGNWGVPKLLKKIGTPYTERAPSFSDDGKFLYFASDGYMGLGGLDIYKVRINIQLSTKSIEIFGQPLNLHLINSTEDELFFRENSKNKFLSSNKSGKWCVYSITKIEKEIKENLSGGIQTSDGETKLKIIPFPGTDGLRVEIFCSSSPSSDGYTRISGHILDQNNNEVKNAEIIFFNIDTTYNTSAYQGGIRGLYTGSVWAGRKYMVKATGYKDEKPLKYLSQSYIDVCESKEMIYNTQLGETSKLVKNKIEAPFFFEFDIKEVTDINNFDKMRQAFHLFKDLENEKSSDNRLLIFKGYSDHLWRGKLDKSCDLSKERAEAARDFLLEKYPFLKKIKTVIEFGCGTREFDNDPNYKSYSIYLTPKYTSEAPEDKEDRQKNRRVEVFLVDNTKYIKIDTSKISTMKIDSIEDTVLKYKDYEIKVKFVCQHQRNNNVHVEGTIIDAPEYNRISYSCDKEEVDTQIKNNRFRFDITNENHFSHSLKFVLHKKPIPNTEFISFSSKVTVCPTN